ncbi:uncharacterized protein LAESUDRAFT_443856 [Laetiporus sulphureus 93-53]|uniref:Rhodanese domain-containing protein n=1 Tax=Laetiporus sulphureus 93-53 TaxID=1314785 RepID=A0A165C0A8_9APHY|nr:uncharacterized protein LAESUDRAFT_443856 [Laetiporus sulphureus 93-53]KZT01968.1 hypothetical protein LAESUDRAFT_443856 [Laetiporus sulphureus 93-53]
MLSARPGSSSSRASSLSYGQRRSRVLPFAIEEESDRAEMHPRRTLNDVREETAQSMALRAIRQAETVDGSRIGVILTLSYTANEHFLLLIASSLKHALLTRTFLFAVAAPRTTPDIPGPVLFCGSSDDFVQRAGMLFHAKFVGRIASAPVTGKGLWIGSARNIGASSFDEAALWDIVRKSARSLIDPLVPPPGSRSAAQLLSDARARLERITPKTAYNELHDPASPWPIVLVDIRPEAQRRTEGTINGALTVERNMLEWRFDPRSARRLPVANRYDLRVILFCQDSDTSSLAAASLHDIGMLNATDIIGGYAAWKEAGLPAVINSPVSPSEPSDEY